MKVFRQTVQHLKNNFTQYFILEAIVMALSSSFIMPQILRFYNWAMIQAGTPYVLNVSLIQPELFSVRFWMTLLGIMVFAILLLIQYLVLMVLIESNIQNRPVTIGGSFWITLKNLKRLIFPGFIQIVTMGIVFVPFVFSTTQLTLMNIPITFIEWFQKIGKLDSYWIILLILWLYIHIHSLYLMYYMLIHQLSTREAFKRSFKMIRRHQLKTLIHWVPVLLIVLLVWLFLGIWMQTIAEWMNVLIRFVALKKLVIYLLSIIAYSILLLSFPFIITYLMFLFRAVMEKDREEIPVFQFRSRKVKWPKWVHALHKITGLILTITIIVTFGINYLWIESFKKSDVKIAAHRGNSSDAPENTLSSVQSAIAKQIDYVEIDIMLTEDGTLVLHHDKTLSRTAGANIAISDFPYSVISSYDVGSHFSKKFTGENIPKLEDVLKACKGQIKVIIDIKAEDRLNILIPKLIFLIDALDMENEVYVQSFNTKILVMIRSINPNIKIGQILYYFSGNLAALDVDFYTIRANMLTTDFVKRAHSLDRKVWVWTVNTVVGLNEVMRYNIDGIITDFPERAENVRSLVK